MKYEEIAHLDKPVSKLILGADWFEEEEEAEAVAVLDAFFESGGNTIDMAHVYGGGQGQRIVGRWLRSNGIRDQIVLLDKGCHPYGHPRMTPADLDADLADNLERLQVDSVDIFVLHRDDESISFEPILRRLNDHIREGRIKLIGASNWTTQRIAEANAFAASEGLQGFSLNNPNLSLALPSEPVWPGCRWADTDDLAWHTREQFPLFSWASQGGGFFAGRDTPDIRRVYWSDLNFARKARLEEMARRRGVGPITLALAWVLSQPFPIWALVGPRKPGELEASFAALDIQLSADERRWLEGSVPGSGEAG